MPRKINADREQFYSDMFSEISPAYVPWASVDWDEDKEEFILTDNEDEGKVYNFPFESISKGWHALVKLERAGKWRHCQSVGGRVASSEYSLANHGSEHNADYDACVVDAVVQLALFGKVVYG